MMKFKKLKPILLAVSLMTAGSLTACSPKKQEQNTAVKETTTTKTEVIKETPVKEVKNEVTEDVKYYNLAAESYNNYTEFYARSKMAYADENAIDGINIERIENIIKVINGEVSDLTSDEVINAKEDINYILLSQDLVTDLDNIIARDLGYITIDGEMKICEAPKLSIYASDKETKEFTEKYETLRDRVQLDINSTGSISDETKKELKEAVIQMEKDYLVDDNQMNDDVTAEGNKLLENLAKESLVELTALATNESRIMTDEFPGGLKLIAETDEERDIESKAKIHGLEILTDREKEIYAKDTMERIVTKYEEGVCAHMENLANHAKSNTNTHSKLELLKNKRDMLIAKKEQERNYTYTL